MAVQFLLCLESLFGFQLSFLLLYNKHMKKIKLKNYRDLHYIKSKNNIRIKKGMISRSAFLFNLSKGCINWFNKLNIDVVLDLRSPKEIERFPESKVNSEYRNVSFENPKFKQKDDGLDRASYWTFLDNKKCDEEFANHEFEFYSNVYTKVIYNNKAIAEIFKLMSEHKSFIYHCHGGKDRTGVCSYLILNILGFTKEEIIKDYLKTNNKFIVFIFNLGMKILGFNKNGIKAVKVNTFAVKDLIESTEKEVKEKYETVENFLFKEYKITKEMIDDFKQFYLE